MRKFVIIAFLLLLAMAVIAVFTGGNPLLLIQPSSPAIPQKVDVGFTLLNTSTDLTSINFQDISDSITYIESPAITRVNLSATNTTIPVKQVRLIRGSNLDEKGDARNWMVILLQHDEALMASYDLQGSRVDPWQGSYPDSVVNISAIMRPRELFRINHDLLFSTPDAATTDTRNLALAGNTYYLTITTGQGKTRNLEFNAITGALTSSND